MKINMMKIFKAITSVNTIKKLPLGGLGGLILLTSCEKEISIDYHTVEPLYVVEAGITESGAVARISQTQNVTDEMHTQPVDNAVIQITSDTGERSVLHRDSAGCYSSDIKGVEGRTYTIRVQIGDYVTESTSQMQGRFDLSDNYMYKMQMLEDDLVYYHVDVNDNYTDSIGYYYALVTRNGKPYKWHVMNNKGYFDVTGIDVPCFVYCDLDKDNKDILQDGEEISLEVRKIDRRTYDYLYVLAKAEQSASNPIRNFSNPATLGYFSAYNAVRKPALRFEKEALQYYEEITAPHPSYGHPISKVRADVDHIGAFVRECPQVR